MDWLRAWAVLGGVTLAAVALIVASIATSAMDHQRMRVLDHQNQDLRQVQIEQQKRLQAAEQQAADAQAAADQARSDVEQMQEQLDRAEHQTSGS